LHGEPDDRAEVARIEANYQARVAAYEASFREHCAAVDEIAAHPEWQSQMFVELQVTGGKVVMTKQQAMVERDRMIREAKDDRERDFRALEQKRQLMRSAPAKGGAVEKDYDGPAIAKVVRELKLAERNGQKRPSSRALAERSNGQLARNAVMRIERLITVGMLDWDFDRDWLGANESFGPTPGTISLRALERTAGLEPLT
jgi:hypothetical protein